MQGFVAAGMVIALTTVRAALKAIESNVIAGVIGQHPEIESGTADHTDPPHNIDAFSWSGHSITSFH